MENNNCKSNSLLLCCPQCKKISTAASNRLVRDSCGHQKCRVCLLIDEDKCRQCQNIDNNNCSIQSVKERDPKESVIKYEGVITSASRNHDLEVKSNNNKKQLINGANENIKKIKKDSQKHKFQIPSHIIVTRDPALYKCSICNKQFATKYHVKFHIHCTGVPKPYRCDQCSKEFITRTHLQIHTLGHADRRPFSCTICQKSFSEKYKLKRHTALHSSLKPYVCSECGKAFRAKDSLKLHYLIHRGEKPYKCKVCSAKFTNPSNLNRHLISHSKEKDHMCDQCGKRFKLKWSLTVHRRSHQRIRPYECNVCYKSFINNKDLQRHQLIHIESKVYSCTICGTNFRRKDNLYRHGKNIHNSEKILGQKTVKQIIEPPTKPLAAPLPKPVVDNPNAIKVITASPLCNKNVTEKATERTNDGDNRSVIFGPLKLAFKTTAFKNNYNINREYNLQESVNICQKIFDRAPPSPPVIHPQTAAAAAATTATTRTIIKKAEPTSNEICQKILSSYAPPSPIATPIKATTPPRPPHYETSFEHKKHAIIKNIKFKLPANYTNLFKTTNGTTNDDKTNIIHSDSKTYAELKTVSTSVIVNSQQTDSSNLHWRRRTSQNLSLKMD